MEKTGKKDSFVKTATMRIVLCTVIGLAVFLTLRKDDDKKTVFAAEYSSVLAEEIRAEDIAEFLRSFGRQDPTAPAAEGGNGETAENSGDAENAGNGGNAGNSSSISGNSGGSGDVSGSGDDSGNGADASDITSTVVSTELAAGVTLNYISHRTPSEPATVSILAKYLDSESVIPVSGRISSPFGERVSPITGYSELHRGVDIAAGEGSAIAAAHDGVVVSVSSSAGRGKYLIIRRDDGCETLYQHCSKILVDEGTVVRCGETVALVGSTGDCTGPHLHLEFRIDGEAVDPMKYLFSGIEA